MRQRDHLVAFLLGAMQKYCSERKKESRESESDLQRQTERHRGIEIERQRDRETERQKNRETERQRQDKHTNIYREIERQSHSIDRNRDRG